MFNNTENSNFGLNNFNKVFLENQSIMNNTNYVNKNNLLHNNLAKNILDEQVVEYKINIDSFDRDIKVYPNPFSFTVKFNPPSGNTLRTEFIETGKTKMINDYFPGPPSPHINKEFKNVKYIRLESVILPQHNKIMMENNKCIFDSDSSLFNDRFVSLVIKEFGYDTIQSRTYCSYDSSNRINSNGQIISVPRPFGIIYPDKIFGKNFYVGCPANATKIFQSSNLGNIKQLTIELYDSYGNQLKMNNIFNYDDLIKAEDSGNPITLEDFRHPLNKKIQLHFSFAIGVVENRMNTNINF
ncbi:Hypothetical protein KVN_LOCUS289 [uncultured virus]|nr:Hypothetical protein KVN_LOCUS289 [uncultured virus]